MHLWLSIKKRYLSLGIRNKIGIAFAAVFALFLMLIMLIVNAIAQKVIIKKTEENFLQNLNLVSGKVDILLNSLDNDSKIAIINSNIQQILRETGNRAPEHEETIKIRQALSEIIEPKHTIETMTILQENGNVFEASNSRKTYGGPNVIKRYIELVNASANKRTYWMKADEALYTQNEILPNEISFLRAVIDARTGKSMGILETVIREECIGALYADISDKYGTEIFILDREGKVISHLNKSLLRTDASDTVYYPWVKSNGSTGRTFALEGGNYLVVGKENTRIGWIIVGKAPLAQITAEGAIFTKTIFALGFIFIAAAVFVIQLVASTLTKPIAKLKQTMRSVAQGDFQAVAEAGTTDEIGLLALEFNKMVQKTVELFDKVYFEQNQKRKLELSLIQLQVNPHFLYNTLEVICDLAELNENSKIVEVVNELALFYRSTLSAPNGITSVSEEIKTIERYLKILKVRYTGTLNYVIEIQQGMDDYLMIKLLLQPIVENAICHGIKNKKGGGTIVIRGYRENNTIIFEIIDDGVGIKPDVLSRLQAGEEGREGSFGLINTRRRIKLYFGESYGLTIASEYGRGACVKLTLPAKLKGGELQDVGCYHR